MGVLITATVVHIHTSPPMQTVRVGRHVAPASRVGLTWLNLPPGPQLRSPVTHAWELILLRLFQWPLYPRHAVVPLYTRLRRARPYSHSSASYWPTLHAEVAVSGVP